MNSDNKLVKIIIVLIVAFAVVGVGLTGYIVFGNKLANRHKEGQVVISLFYGDGCPHCRDFEEFLDALPESTKKHVIVNKYEIWFDEVNNKLADKVADYFGTTVTGVPFYIIGNRVFGGYSESRNEIILDTIEDMYQNEIYEDIVAKLK